MKSLFSGIATEDVVFKPETVFVATSTPLRISTSWSIGTDVTYHIDFKDGSTYDWKYETEDHTLSYKALSTSASHTYTRYANFTMELHICSSVSCTDHTSLVVVQPNLKDYIQYGLDYFPKPAPTPVVFVIELINSTFVYPVSATCTFHFNDEDPDESVERNKDIGDEVITVDFTYIVFRHTSICKIHCANAVSEVTFDAVVALQENITGLLVEPSAVAYSTDSAAEIDITVDTGSNIVFNISFGDTMSEFLSFNDSWKRQEPLTITHAYDTVGNYSLSVFAYNVHFDVVAAPQHDIIIQNEVKDLTVSCGNNFPFPPATVTCTVTPDATHHPTDVFCDFSLNGISAEMGSYLPELSEGTPVDHAFVARLEHVGAAVPVDITCRNLVNQQPLSTTTSIYIKVSNLSVAVDSMRFVKGEVGYLHFQVKNGSSVDFRIEYGPGDIVDIKHPLLFANEQALTVNHTYTTIGNKTLKVTASNPVSSEVLEIPEPVIVQNRITNISYTSPAIVLWPREHLTFRVTIGAEQEELRDIHCTWDIGGISTIYQYIERATSGENLDYTDPLLRSHIGLQNIVLNCSNLVSSSVMVQESNITLDAVILDQLTCNESVWWKNTSGFFLDVGHYGQHSCFLWDMGADDAMFMYGESDCEEDANEKGYTFTLIEHGTMVIGHDYKYSDWGVFTVTVFAYNDVSNDTITTQATVWEWICLIPNITFQPVNDTDESNPMVRMRSKYFEITVLVDVFCFYTSYTDDQWVITDVNSGAEVSSVADQRSFIHNPRDLPYGLYSVAFNSTMHNIPEKGKIEIAFLEIIKTPLNVSIIGGNQTDIDFGILYEFDAISLTSDPDVTPGDLTGITFAWTCIQQNVTKLETEMKHRMKDYDTIFPDDRTDHCLTPPQRFSSSNEGTFSVNTSLFYPMTSHLVTITIAKDTRMSTFEQIAYIKPPIAPVTEVTWVIWWSDRTCQM